MHNMSNKGGSSNPIQKHGGVAYIRDTEVPVWEIAMNLMNDVTEEEILASKNGLSQNDINEAMAYYVEHKREIDQLIWGDGSLLEVSTLSDYYEAIKGFDKHRNEVLHEALGHGLFSELGEVAGMFEGLLREPPKYSPEEFKSKLLLELGDVLYYITLSLSYHNHPIDIVYYGGVIYAERSEVVDLLSTPALHGHRTGWSISKDLWATLAYLEYMAGEYCDTDLQGLMDRNVVKLTERHGGKS